MRQISWISCQDYSNRFFFQAEDGIRDLIVTGVQTCALPIYRTGAMHPLTALLISAGVVVVTWAVCFVERGQRKILVNYAKRQIGNKVYGGQASPPPLKLKHSRVQTPLFAPSINLFPPAPSRR